MANGVRLATASDAVLIEPWMRALEEGRLHCRRATVALLGIKRHRGVLRRVDRFVVREIAWAVYATRQAVAWQAEAHE